MTGSAGAVAPVRIAVLGDDLTGAADAAAPFADRGRTVSVALTDRLPEQVDVVAVVTDSRWRPAAEAAAAVRAAVARLRAWEPGLLFVKVDSTLRGRVRDDVSVALQEWGSPPAVATPAFPAQGRVVRDGALLVHGTTLVADVADRFPPGVRVVDAVAHEDLLGVARELVAGDAVAVGSGGLARALAEVLAPGERPASSDAVPAARGVLAVVGTPHPVTRAQADALLASGATAVVVGGEAAPEPAAATALAEGRRVLLTCDAGAGVEPDSPAAAALAAHVARTVRAITDRAPAAGLVLTGGATALAVATALGATEFRLRREVTEGLPLGELVTGDRRLPVVTKSGGFGDPHALVRAAEALEGRP